MALPAINLNPQARTLRWFAGLWLPLFAGLLGLRLWMKTGSLTPALVCWVAAAAVSLACLAYLPLARGVFVGLTAATAPLGYVASHVILAVVFFGVITPIGLLLRAFGVDPMRRKLDRAAKSYWIARAAPAPAERYFRPY